MPVRHILLALAIVAIWGFNFVVIKLSVDALPPLLAAALRFLFAAFPALLFFKPPKTSWLLVIGFGLSYGFGLYLFLNIAIATGMPAGLASVVLQTQAFFTILIAFFVLKESPRWMQILGGAIAFLGVGVIALERFEGAAFLPFGLTLLAALAWGIANVLARRAGRVNPISLTVWGALVATVPLFVMSALTEGPEHLINFVRAPDLWTIGLLVFLAYPATLFGIGAWNYLLARHPALIVAPFTLLVPITGLLSGWLVLGETISMIEIAGGMLVIIGLGVTVIKPRIAGV